MKNRLVRILTAVMVLCVSGPAILRGWNIVRFSAAEAALRADGSGSEAVRSWGQILGLGFAAREASLDVVDDWNDETKVAKRRDQQTAILAVRPMSSEYWLLLSDMRLISGASVSKAIEALAFSGLTGANEHDVMVQRGIFGIAHWEILPPELRSRTANDLVAAPLSDKPFSDTVTNQLKRLLSGKAEEVREDIRAALKAHQVSAKGLAAIGL